MATEIYHSILILIIVVSSFLFSQTPLSSYGLQISALLFVALYLIKKVLPKTQHRLIEASFFTFIVCSIVAVTGNLSSPFFFLLYFLVFFLSLLLEPTISISATVGIVLLNALSAQISSPQELLPLFSLLLLTPFAIFLGREIKREKQLRKTVTETKENTFLFLSLILKNHLDNINKAAENFLGDHQLETIRKNAGRMKKLIDEYEKQI